MATAAVGLSFGTESCVVAVTNTSGQPQVYANADGFRVTPTYVSFIDGEVHHGTAGRAAFVRQPVQSVPYLLPLLSAEVVKNGDLQPKCEVEVVTDEASGEDRVVILSADVDGLLPSALPRPSADETTTPHYTTELLNSFLADLKVKTIDGPVSGRPVGCLCVSVPRYMDQSVVRAAIENAGLAKDVRVIYDDVAAALAYNIGNAGALTLDSSVPVKTGRTDMLVIDWGANVLSTSILRLEAGVFRVISHKHKFGAGAAHLDKALAKNCCDAFYKKTRMNASENAKAMRKITQALDSVRKTLSMSTMCPIHVEAFFEGMDFKDTLSRVKLDMTIRECGLLDTLDSVLKELVENADASEAINVKDIILSGGLCRTQFIQNSIRNAVESVIPGAPEATFHDSLPSDELAAVGACAEAYFTTASYATLTQFAGDVPVEAKCRPIDPTIKDVDTVEAEAVEAGVALYIGSAPFSKLPVVEAPKVIVAMGPASPNSPSQKDFGKGAAENGAYQVPNSDLYTVAARGAPIPVTSPMLEGTIGSAVLPVAVLAVDETHSLVVPLLKRPYKLESADFKILVAAEKKGAVVAVSVVEQDTKGEVKVASRTEW